MNVDQDRPYVCTAPGCSQRFQREDHLIIHRHKHEMTLKFPSIKCDSMLSDQTPTPTRFLRDCEEVGLFTDLELNQSQVEEETKSNFSVQASGHNQPHTETQPQQSQHHQFQPQQQQQCALAHLNQNQLHTHSSQPQPQCTATYSTSNKQSAPSCLHSRQTNALPGTSAMNMEAQLSMNCSKMGIPGPAPSGSCSSLQRSKVIPAHSQPAVSNGSQNPLCHMMEMMSSHQHPLSHLQSASHHHAYQQHCHSQSSQRLVHQHQSQDQSHHSHAHHSPPAHLHPGSTHQTNPPLSHQTIPTQMSSTPKQTPCPQSPPQLSTGRRRRTSEEGPDERREKFLERNRAAATRCRQKRKVWVVSLERKAEELTHTNLQLQNEVTSLRTEVSQLKQILLSHKDCPVSVRQRETQSGVGSLIGSPVQQHAIQHNSISTSSSALPHTHLTPHSHSTNNTQI
ncbi:cyclic AMP-responsive element-binding protein 5-like isoform X2 [Sinocyclocheilus grahami]|uniref:cAMP responsive element binding protein 5 n=1 Tax=Sinocyclocheilus grahami TaxID=75366 RepID=A0A672KUB0_SINGR|nr:PREDICTED: cyclic AMP-responsive element-binding protein 5-like isoform X1 [Sinocyclocheilus grahami]XP_016150369.1 PREDICTED: cyclic AMP-responsive element-binding protein 5-like isoform X1 [Sinocyclocheilus grahami]XP_016150370.1 PREDICTED: cyclic AMP-responsive element-binding protein 5-like isoform X1 [Sinocyclocheilus grahami]XP_016150371.1 PREDICTED: cyclic AMP-responsive element-binding protein 5-like isoform X2 [Sinocyclocheilus grahami]